MIYDLFHLPLNLIKIIIHKTRKTFSLSPNSTMPSPTYLAIQPNKPMSDFSTTFGSTARPNSAKHLDHTSTNLFYTFRRHYS